jgi:ABC-type uncharacterized transport system substrate-binding protein
LVDGQNLQIETRWAGGDPAAIRRHAEQLGIVPPDVIVATGNAAMEPRLQATPTVPIVFNQVVDPEIAVWLGIEPQSCDDTEGQPLV